MAKTTSQIQQERKEVSDYRNAVHQQQMAEIGIKTTGGREPVHQTEYSIVGSETPERQITQHSAPSDSVIDIGLSPFLCGFGGFLLGALVMILYFKIKIKKIKSDCDTRINEARTALDRMLKIAAKE